MGTETQAPERSAPGEQYRAARELYRAGKYVEALSALEALRAQYPKDATIAQAIAMCWAASEARDKVVATRRPREERDEGSEPTVRPRLRRALIIALFCLLAAVPCAVVVSSIWSALFVAGQPKPKPAGPQLQVIQTTVQSPGLGQQPSQRPAPVRTAPNTR